MPAQITPPAEPVFVVGERGAGERLAALIGGSSAFQLVPTMSLLGDLAEVMERHAHELAVLGYPQQHWRQRVAHLYADIQQAQRGGAGKPGTVEYSRVPIGRLEQLFPRARFLVVGRGRRRGLLGRRRCLPPSGRRLEVSTTEIERPDACLKRVLGFLGGHGDVVDLRDALAGCP